MNLTLCLHLKQNRDKIPRSGFNVPSIRARHKIKEREDIVRAFNDPTNPVPVLVTSTRVSATSLNLQAAADVIFVDTPSNAQVMVQAAGRVIRIGQLVACNIYVLTMDHSYDQVLQSIAASKMVSIIAGYTEKIATPEEITKERKDATY